MRVVGRNSPARATVIILCLSWFPAVAAADESAEAFIRGVYARYAGAHGAGVATDARGGGAVYSRDMLNGFAKSSSAAKGDIGPIDYDPICSCQDVKDVRLTTISLLRSDESSALVRVSFTNEGEQHGVTLTLANTPRGWRIADIQDRNVRSVLALLRNADPSP